MDQRLLRCFQYKNKYRIDWTRKGSFSSIPVCLFRSNFRYEFCCVFFSMRNTRTENDERKTIWWWWYLTNSRRRGHAPRWIFWLAHRQRLCLFCLSVSAHVLLLLTVAVWYRLSNIVSELMIRLRLIFSLIEWYSTLAGKWETCPNVASTSQYRPDMKIHLIFGSVENSVWLAFGSASINETWLWWVDFPHFFSMTSKMPSNVQIHWISYILARLTDAWLISDFFLLFFSSKKSILQKNAFHSAKGCGKCMYYTPYIHEFM